jgi:ketosteroid isomerase-like protein
VSNSNEEATMENQASVRDDIREFIIRFQTASARGDAALVEQSFPETFVSLDPSTFAVVPREALLAALPGRRERFSQIGAVGATLTAIVEVPLDDRHTLVRTTWETRFAEHGAQPLVLRSTYLIRREADGWRIVVYLNHQNVAALIAARAEAAAEPAQIG